MMAEPKAKQVKPDDVPSFTFVVKDEDPIVFPSVSTISGDVNGVGMLEFLFEIYEQDLSTTYEMFAWLKRSGATDEMKRRVLRLSPDTKSTFFRKWIADAPPSDVGGLPPES